MNIVLTVSQYNTLSIKTNSSRRIDDELNMENLKVTLCRSFSISNMK